jgi:hypothetical protein
MGLQPKAMFYQKNADVAQEVEHILGEDKVSGSGPDISSSEKRGCPKMGSPLNVTGATKNGAFD